MQSPRLNPIGPLGRDVLVRPQPRRARRRVRVRVLTWRLRRRARVPPRRAPAITSDPQTAHEAGPSSALGTARAPRGQLRVDRRGLRRTRPGAVAAGHSALACASLMAHLRAVLRAGAAGAPTTRVTSRPLPATRAEPFRRSVLPTRSPRVPRRGPRRPRRPAAMPLTERRKGTRCSMFVQEGRRRSVTRSRSAVRPTRRAVRTAHDFEGEGTARFIGSKPFAAQTRRRVGMRGAPGAARRLSQVTRLVHLLQ